MIPDQACPLAGKFRPRARMVDCRHGTYAASGGTFAMHSDLLAHTVDMTQGSGGLRECRFLAQSRLWGGGLRPGGCVPSWPNLVRTLGSWCWSYG